jgi:TrmH family RNA methyltransferase
VEGPQAVREALAAGGLLELFVSDGDAALVALAELAGTPVTRVSGAVLSVMASTVSPQGLLGTAALLDIDVGTALSGAPRLVAVLHEVADPGNAGTVVRTADAAGADAVVLTGSSVDPHNAKCVRATAGSLWHLPVVHGIALAEALTALRATGLQVLATSGSRGDDLDDLLDAGALTAPTAWLFGTEAHGLPSDVLAAADRRVRIPLHGQAESLNLAAAAAVCLYSSARAHRAVQ